jgi:hypothetical protein
MQSITLFARKELMLARYHLRKRKERAQQYFNAKSVTPIGEKKIHLITVNKKAYLIAAIRCANSIWFHSPEIQIVIHIDSHLIQYQDFLLRKLDRKDRVKIQLEKSFQSWQELKLKVILHDLSENDSFCDADLYWNAPIPVSTSGIYFSAEKALLARDPYATAIRDSGIAISQEYFMANSSFIALGKLPGKSSFVEDVESNFQRLRNQVQLGEYEQNFRLKILRLSEQIALSITINKMNSHFIALKDSDKPMDGGVAESYYLGTTKGWA